MGDEDISSEPDEPDLPDQPDEDLVRTIEETDHTPSIGIRIEEPFIDGE